MARGPQVISQPGGSVAIPYSSTTTSIQNAINANPGATTFWIEKGGGTGVRSQTAKITPKSGNTFVFEYGAILDGSSWVSGVLEDASFYGHNLNIDNVTITNATIRNMPQNGVHANAPNASTWIVEYSEIHANDRTGTSMPNGGIVRHCLVHHNTYAGYGAYGSSNVLFDDTEFAYNGSESKIVGTDAVTFSNCWVHHNPNGIWYDTDNTNSVIGPANIVEDNEEMGVFYEISFNGIIYSNTIRRNGIAGIFISSSQDVEAYDNTLEDNWQGINLYLDYNTRVYGYDLQNNHVHDNTVAVGTRAGSIASMMRVAYATSTQQVPYIDNTKNNLWIDNTYTVPATGTWWYWGTAHKTWAQWQAIPQDAAGMEFPGGSPSGSPGGGTGGTIGGGDGGYTVVCSCFERNTGSGLGPWQLFADDGTLIGPATGTPYDPFGPGAFGMGRLANGRIWLAGETYFFTCADDFSDVSPTPQPGDPETPGPFHYTGFNGGQGGNYVYMIGLRAGFGAQNYLIEIDPDDWSEVRSWTVPSNYGFPNIGVDEGHTVAYYADQGGTVVKKMVLSSGTESNFLTGISGTSGIIVLPDDTVVIAHDSTVKRYNASATLLNTYSDGSPYGGQGNLAHGIDGNNSFLLMGTPEGSGRAHLYEFEVDTEAVLNDFEFPVYTGLRFEAPFSVIPASAPVVVDPPPGTTPPPTIINSTPCCGHDETTGPNPGPIPPGFGWEPQCLGGGLTPTAVALVDSENWDV